MQGCLACKSRKAAVIGTGRRRYCGARDEIETKTSAEADVVIEMTALSKF
jgi:hypothetical protein